MKKRIIVVVIILLSLFSLYSATSNDKRWTNIHFKKTTGELVSDTYTIKVPGGFCQVDITPDKNGIVSICGRGIDYSNSTEDESREINDRFRITDDQKVNIARKIGTLITTDEGDKFIETGYPVFTKKCLPLVKGSNLPMIAQETLRELE